MTLYQYSRLQRLLGKLEGLGEGIPANIRQEYDEVLLDLGAIIEQIMRNGEKNGEE